MERASYATQVPANLSVLLTTVPGLMATAATVASIGLIAIGNEEMGLLVALPTSLLMAALSYKQSINRS